MILISNFKSDLNMVYTKILGTGSYFPLHIRTNYDLEKIVNTSNEWIISRTGIKERRIASKMDSVSSMGAKAAKNALIMANISVSEIEFIVVATTSSNYAFPSVACQIQKILGIKNCIAFDIAAACSGFNYALSICDQYIKTGMIKNGLIVASDILSRVLNPKDRSTLVLFGDAASAVVVGSSDKPGVLSTHLYANGRYGDLLVLENNKNTENRKPKYLLMVGNEVFKIAVNKSVDVFLKTLKKNSVKKNELDWFIPHQANLRIIQAIAKKLSISMEKIIVILKKYGNISAASVPAAFDEAVRDGRIKRGDIILLEAFGGGLTWGSALIKF